MAHKSESKKNQVVCFYFFLTHPEVALLAIKTTKRGQHKGHIEKLVIKKDF